MENDTSEFRYLPGQAAALGVAAPQVRRLTLALPDGRTLGALRFGEGAPEVTLLHGAGLNAHTWDTTALLLQRPALAIDLAGHGDSSWREDLDYSPQTLAADVAHALDAWTDAPQVLVGQSLGGLTAVSVAATHPASVRDLVIVDITAGVRGDAAPAVLAEFYQQTDFASLDEAVDRAMSFGFGSTRPETERGVFLNTRVRADGRVEWKHHFAHLASAALATTTPDAGAAILASDRSWSDLAAVTAPIILVRATKGFVSDADAAEFATRRPDAEIRIIDATHNIQETAPAALAGLIAESADAVRR
ncbi:alpha/beta hydrolase [Microbacterium sp. KUDC0406]|uniref:alpha/beta fold hydrolase n=1 Tax=Microbacterium sp. KUDC0406 TaxID=2909588 RepID=UPI001F46E2DB|nr:alpha/beta hydrolase [Microbacterium sp. KUDC0406]UJP11404.1 alpha/beta hydrolase [Microbacterium sp. KUDC0406]